MKWSQLIAKESVGGQFKFDSMRKELTDLNVESQQNWFNSIDQRCEQPEVEDGEGLVAVGFC